MNDIKIQQLKYLIQQKQKGIMMCPKWTTKDGYEIYAFIFNEDQRIM